MNYSILFSIKVGGPYINPAILKKALESISLNIYTKNYQIIIFYETDIPSMLNFIENINDDRIIKKKVEKHSWYNWMKSSSHIAKNFDYLFLMHDDIFFITKNFDYLLNQKISNISNIGIVNLKDTLFEDAYYKTQTRHGFYIDRIYNRSSEKGQFAEFFQQKPNWHHKNIRLKNFINRMGLEKNRFLREISSNFYFNKNKMQMPDGIIKAHGGTNDLMIFKKNNLNIFDKICDFRLPYGLYSDEDISLESLKSGLINILISDISYKSNYEFNFVTTRSFTFHSNDRKKCDEIFRAKWGFSWLSSEQTINENVSSIKKAERLHGSNIVWTKDFFSYDYQYL